MRAARTSKSANMKAATLHRRDAGARGCHCVQAASKICRPTRRFPHLAKSCRGYGTLAAKCRCLPGNIIPPTPAPRSLPVQTKATVSVDAPTETETSTDQESSQYVWTKNWWPLVPISYLDPKKPKAMTVLGVQLVVWKDGEGTWRVFKDACPHRLAPLSEGRVEADGTLLCSYHAWRFNGEGKCTTIPQSVTPEAEATACNSRRSCAVAFPSQVDVGLLWVWPDESDTRWIESAATPLTVSNIVKERFAAKGELNWFMRDLPYGYEVLVENVTDPAHVPVSHHSLAPTLSRYNLRRMEMSKIPDPTLWTSYDTPFAPVFDLTYSSPFGPEAASIVKFTGPTHVQLGSSRDGAWMTLTSLYCIPVGPGKARVIHNDARNMLPPAHKGPIDAVKQTITRLMMTWMFTPVVAHRTMNRLFDGDGVFLNMQQTTLQQQHKGDWKRAYYLPASCDRGVAAARSWIDKVGHPFPMESIGAQGAVVDRRALLDRYDTHTKHCPLCQAEVKRLSAWIQGAKVLAAVCFLVACIITGSVGWQGLVTGTAPFVTQAGACVAALLGAAAWSVTKWSSQLEDAKKEFFFTDWVHAERD